MEVWEKALQKFVERWQNEQEVIGVLLCGSYVTGKPGPRSDLDVHIILQEETDWRERGNEYIDGFLIEYFANPPRQIRQYFKEDFYDRSTMSMVQFITGKVLFDTHGIIAQLKQEALEWKNKQQPTLDPVVLEMKKYSLWDANDNLLDCYEKESMDFTFVYSRTLQLIFDEYCAILQVEQIPFYHIKAYLSEPGYLTKYVKAPFPDLEFSSLFLEAMAASTDAQKLKCCQQLI